MLLKFFFILILVIYTFYKVAGFLFRVFFGSLKSSANSENFNHQTQSKKAPNSNLSIDEIPQKRTSRTSEFDGGDYVDFEEVK